jgi:hypothetical protein
VQRQCEVVHIGLRAAAKAELAADPGEVGKLERQLKAARTRSHSLTVEKNAAWQARDEARRANPVTIITKAQYALLQKAFHPDQEHDTATPSASSSY